ncbi:MAG: zinc-dependent alcohol dehydrogenase, partial [Anaerolineae bacterium]
MKAVVLRGVNDLRLEDLPAPRPAPNEALIRIMVSGICGTDVHMWEGKNQEGTFPFIPGHEWTGEVIEVGREIKTIKVGDRVTGEPFISCKVCPSCRDGLATNMCTDWEYYGFTWDTPGGMAEYVATKEERLFKLPDNVSYEEGALMDPVSCAYFAVWARGGGAAPHDRVVVFGAGPIGLCAFLTCKASGAPVIVVEPMAERAQLAREMGADAVLDPRAGDIVQQIADLTGGRGATLVIECSGSDAALAATVDVVAKQGRIVLIGQSVGRKVPIEIGKLIWQGAQVIGSCGSPHYYPKTLAFMSRHLVDITRIITHR